MTDFLLLAFIFLTAGIVAVPIATRLGLGSVLGYLIAGICISPLLAGIGVDVISIQHFAEFGVVMMLFLVGLELEPSLLWRMRSKLLGLGGLQVLGSVGLIAGAAVLLGQPWTVGVAIGFVFCLSSTAIVLQTLNEKGLMKSDAGQASFAVLLFQDIAVIPMLAIIPLLALPELTEAVNTLSTIEFDGGGHASDEGHEHGLSLVAGLTGWQTGLATIAAVGVVILGGTYLTRPIFRFIAMAGLRELFTATALFFVVGIALLMSLVGLSPALGTFLAGVVLANSEYRHELQSDIDPFRGLLLGLFFMTVGASIDFRLLFASLGVIIALTLGMMAIKTGVLLILGRIFRLEAGDSWLVGLGLAQAGEFGFVLLSLTVASNAIPQQTADYLLLIVALSMLLTPGFFVLHERLIEPRYRKTQQKTADDIDEVSDVIIAGHGRFGGIVNRMLRAAGYTPTVLDYSASQLELLRTFGFKVFFGDATRPDLLHAAGIAEAKLLVIAIDEREQITELVRYVRKTYPDVHIIARAVNRPHVYELYAAGCRDIVRETFDSGVRTGRSAYEAMGMHPFDAERLSRKFVEYDKYAISQLAETYDPAKPIHRNAAYVARSRALMEERENEVFASGGAFAARIDRGWSPPKKEDVDAAKAKGAKLKQSD
ncbi:MAG: cation:proton antiporter [Pseudomonadota bacterium]